MLLGSERHTAGATTRWVVNYARFLDNPANITAVSVNSSSASCTVASSPVILGKEVVFFLTGGNAGETFTVTITITDSYGNIQPDTIKYTVVPQ